MNAEHDIVLVDDDELVHEFVGRLLLRAGRTFTGFRDPRVAREALVIVPARLLIVDTLMPDLDGIALLEALPKKPAARTILCSSGRLDNEQIARTRRLGIDFMDKAVLFDRKRFVALIE